MSNRFMHGEIKHLTAEVRAYVQQLGQSAFSISPDAFAFFQSTKLEPKSIPLSAPQQAMQFEAQPFRQAKPEAKKISEPILSKEHLPALKLETAKPFHAEPTTEWEKIVKQAAPHLAIVSDIPDDASAKRIANLWKEECTDAHVLLFFINESPQEVNFIKNIAKAVSLYLAPAKVIDASRLEQENKWDLIFKSPQLKLILAAAPCIHGIKGLQTRYKEIPATSQCFLQEVPLLLLAPFSSYFKTPLLKRSLWNKLRQILT